MPAKPKKAAKKKSANLNANVADYRHDEAKRKNNPPAKIAAEGTVPLMPKIAYAYSPRLAPELRFDPTGAPDKLPELLEQARRRALTAEETKILGDALRREEPWLEWAGKREKRGFEVDPVALHIHERISAQAILKVAARQDVERSLFADPEQQYHEAVQFYKHDIDWTNRLILGDSLQVMTSLSRREDLAGKIQMIYMDPPYGIRFGSNFQPEVGKRDVKDKEQDLTRELEMVKAYRDTWYLGLHSYLAYLRDRLVASKELLTPSGSIFVQIGDENLDLIASVLNEVFGKQNKVGIIAFSKSSGTSSPDAKTNVISKTCDYLLWYARDLSQIKYRQLFSDKRDGASTDDAYSWLELASGIRVQMTAAQLDGTDSLPEGGRPFTRSDLTSQKPTTVFDLEFNGERYSPLPRGWRTTSEGMRRLQAQERLIKVGTKVRFVQYMNDFPVFPLNNMWDDTGIAGFASEKMYVVQTSPKVLARCLQMTTDPGDLVLDPTCGSGTTAFVAEQWGRRWITTDTSRVAIAIARQRLMTAKYEMYALRDEAAGLVGNFKYKTVPHITLKSIAQNTNLDPIFAKHHPSLHKALAACNAALKQVSDDARRKLADKLLRKQKEEGRKAITDADRRRWELPEKGKGWEHWQVPFDTDCDWPKSLADAVSEYRKAWRAKMDEVNACIAANAEQEELVDQPVKVPGVVRVSGPFTVEAVQPPEMALGDANHINVGEFGGAPEELETFSAIVSVREVETRVEQEAKNIEAYLDQMIRLLKLDSVNFLNNKVMKFSRLEPVYDGTFGIHAEGRWANGEKDPDPDGRANVGVTFGPQYGPVTAKQVEEAIRESSRRGYDHLVVAGFNFDGAAYAVISETKLPKLKFHLANIRPDVNPGMAGLLKEQPGSQLFTVFGQPRVKPEGPNGDGEYTVTMEGVDIYNPVDNSITPTKADKVAAWFVDGDYDGRTFCITQAFFPDKDAWGKLSKALDGVVDPDRFEALSGTKSLPFPLGKHKTVAVKVIDPRGNEVMSVHKLNGARRG